MSLNRREFLSSGVAITVASPMSASVIPSAIARADDEAPVPSEVVRVGVVGLNGRGSALTQAFHSLPDARITALCDVDSEVLRRRSARWRIAGRRWTPTRTSGG